MRNRLNIDAWFRWFCERGAKKRGLQVDITADDIVALYKKQKGRCRFTGMHIFFPKSMSDRERHKGTVSIDRIDSELHYTKDNIQLVHKDINMIKRNLPDARFIMYCKMVANNENRHKCDSN